jgi:6-pyruvoyltetrahydropterin/6-carboxytetrahydropterin synthase
MSRVRLVKQFTFEAAHRLPKVPKEHKCFRLHGHSFRVEVVVEGEINPDSGWLLDYDDIRKAFEPLRVQLDHYYLNEIEGLENPTSEHLAQWIWTRLKPSLPELAELVVHETCASRCVFNG